eukprot:scaffold18704_cov108-Isochrysis_galbana.AAC.3
MGDSVASLSSYICSNIYVALSGVSSLDEEKGSDAIAIDRYGESVRAAPRKSSLLASARYASSQAPSTTDKYKNAQTPALPCAYASTASPFRRRAPFAHTLST